MRRTAGSRGRVLAVLLWSALAANSVFVGVAAADGILRDSMGGRVSGRAGANVAHVDNGAIIYSNPSGVVGIEGDGLVDLRLDIYGNGFQYADVENPQGRDSRQPPAVLPEGSVIRKTADGRFAYGIGMFVPGGFGTDYLIKQKELGEQHYRSNSLLAKILPVVGVRITEKFRVGATVGLAINQIAMKAPYYIQTGPTAGTLSRTTVSGWGYAPTWSLGMQYELDPRTRLGIAYAGETRFSSHGSARVHVGPEFSKYDAAVSQKFPQSVAVGIRHEFEKIGVLSIDGTWLDWSHAFKKIGFTLEHGSGSALPSRLTDQLRLKWRDSYGVRVGYEYTFPALTVRCGYSYHSSPVPSQQLNPLIPGILEHVVAVGGGTVWSNWELDIAYQYSFGGGTQVEDSAFVGGDYDGSSLRSNSNVLFLSATHYL